MHFVSFKPKTNGWRKGKHLADFVVQMRMLTYWNGAAVIHAEDHSSGTDVDATYLLKMSNGTRWINTTVEFTSKVEKVGSGVTLSLGKRISLRPAATSGRISIPAKPDTLASRAWEQSVLTSSGQTITKNVTTATFRTVTSQGASVRQRLIRRSKGTFDLALDINLGGGVTPTILLKLSSYTNKVGSGYKLKTPKYQDKF